MRDEYDVIVVGGGLAGLTSAAFLCKYGYRTLVCEKSNKTGGLVNTFWHQGYAFDSGIRAFENSGIILPMLKSLGIDIEFTKNPVSIGINNKLVQINSRDSLKEYISMLTDLFPENKNDIIKIEKLIKKVISYMDVLYGIDNPIFLENMKDKEYLTKTLLPWVFKYIINIRKVNRLDEPINTYLKRITNNQSLIDMITQHFFENTPTFFAMSYFGVYLDYIYPLGGTIVLAQKLTEYIKSAGGDIQYEAQVTSVDVQKQQITTNNQKYSFSKLVWAADQRTLYSSLCDYDSKQVDKQYNLVSKCDGGDSILTVFMGININKEYFQEKCGAHAFYTPQSTGLSVLNKWTKANSSIDKLYEWVSRYLELTTYEISCPVLRDSTLAPIGKTGLIISTLIDYHLVKHMSSLGEYDSFKKYCIKKIESVIKNSLFSEIHNNIEFSICSTPLTVEKETSNYQGAITGWAFTNPDLPAVNRFMKIAKSTKTPIKNVFQCGQWTFSPSGLPISILTGKMAADKVRKKMKGLKK